MPLFLPFKICFRSGGSGKVDRRLILHQPHKQMFKFCMINFLIPAGIHLHGGQRSGRPVAPLVADGCFPATLQPEKRSL